MPKSWRVRIFSISTLERWSPIQIYQFSMSDFYIYIPLELLFFGELVFSCWLFACRFRRIGEYLWGTGKERLWLISVNSMWKTESKCRAKKVPLFFRLLTPWYVVCYGFLVVISMLKLLVWINIYSRFHGWSFVVR